MNTTRKIKISAIIPVYNEEKHIQKVWNSIENQTINKDIIEYIFIDGGSTDKTLEILKQITKKTRLNIKLLSNKLRVVPTSLNIGIKQSIGNYIVRLDSHTYYPDNYIEDLYLTMLEKNVENVGGIIEHQGRTNFARAYASLLSDKFGVGNSSFRISKNSGYVDTVPFGFFKKEVFKEVGYFDERLLRNQDYELNSRIIHKGGRIYLNANIYAYYQVPSNLLDIIKQNFNNGKWNIITTKITKSSMALRHYIPLLFVLSLVLLPITRMAIFIKLWFLELFIYFFIAFIFSFKADKLSIKEKTIKIPLFLLVHVSYGIGSIVGLLEGRKSKR